MARRIFAVSLVAMLLCLGLPGCKSDQEKAVSKQIDMMNELADKLAGIKSNTDLVSAKSDLEKLGAKMNDLQNDTKKMTKPTADEDAALEKKYKPDMEKAQTRISDEISRIGKDVGPMAPLEIFGDLKLDTTDGSPFGGSSKMPM